ncbi:MAG: alpha/beta hydrolase [Phycisphaerales bacterium]
MKKGLILVAVIVFALSTYCEARNYIVPSLDGQLISYNVFGKGDVTLVFVHGLNCDSRYWQNQVPYFEKKYQVVTIDLAGFGHSEQNREDYTLEAFGQDVKAVVEDIKATKVILIGHSMGDGIIAEAAKLMPVRVIGLIGVDTINHLEESMPKEEADKIFAGLRTNYKAEFRRFVEPMLGKNMNAEMKIWIVNDMSCGPSRITISTIKNYISRYDNFGMANTYKEIKVPVRCVNGDLWPTNAEVNRKYISSFDVTIMKGCGHFPMLERPEEFNKNLNKYVKELLKIKK